MYNAKAYSAASTTSPLASTKIAQRDPTEHDVQIEIRYYGICHTDLHYVRGEWNDVMPTLRLLARKPACEGSLATEANLLGGMTKQ